MIEKSYVLTEEQNAAIDLYLAESSAAYALIADVILESTFDAGVFFEHEI